MKGKGFENMLLGEGLLILPGKRPVAAPRHPRLKNLPPTRGTNRPMNFIIYHL